MNERRRTLLFSGGYKIPTENGVYIESVTHKFYLTDDWDTANTANSIAVVADECKFRIALTGLSSDMQMNNSNFDPWETYLSGITDETVAKTDYNGAYNTQQILTLQPSTEYAAGWCNAYTFPDGKTKGYLPALGELYLAYQNKDAINAALTKCGGAALVYRAYYWSSTFYGLTVDEQIMFWRLYLYDSYVMCDYVYGLGNCVRAFGTLEDSN